MIHFCYNVQFSPISHHHQYTLFDKFLILDSEIIFACCYSDIKKRYAIYQHRKSATVNILSTPNLVPLKNFEFCFLESYVNFGHKPQVKTDL